MKFKILSIGLLFNLFAFVLVAQNHPLSKQINKIIKSKKATIGVAITNIETGDTLSINGKENFYLFSVIKVPAVLAAFNEIDNNKLSLDKKIHFVKSKLDTDTYSPLRDEHSQAEFDLTIKELMVYAITQSDNIAYEILVEQVGGIKIVQQFVTQVGIENISILSTYKEGFEATLKNTSTPVAFNQLLIKAFNKQIISKASQEEFWKIMYATSNGTDRLKGLLPIGTKVAHKTGTCGMDDKGINLAFNDVGILDLPNGKHVAISVFIKDSKESDQVNAQIIAEIAKVVWDYYSK